MKELKRAEDLEACLEQSDQVPVFIYKHSTACPISWGAADRVATFLATAPEETPDFYQVLVIESRPVSNLIASMLDIPHKSPQLILVKDRQALWSASHHNITRESILEAMQEHIGAETP